MAPVAWRHPAYVRRVRHAMAFAALRNPAY